MSEEAKASLIPPPPFEGAAPRRIVCSAIKHGVTGTIVVGPRHFDKTMHMQIERCGGSAHWKTFSEQGFIDQFGEFHDRSVSWAIAREAGQIWRLCGGSKVARTTRNFIRRTSIEMKHFTLDVKLWRCGNSRKADSESLGGGQTLLYQPEYTVHCMCIMGQMLWQAGALPEDLARLAGPDTYQQFMIEKYGVDSWGTPELHDLLKLLVTSNNATPPGLMRSRFARDLEVINDDVFAWCSVVERIGRLRQRLLEEGIEMSLKNYGYGTLGGG